MRECDPVSERSDSERRSEFATDRDCSPDALMPVSGDANLVLDLWRLCYNQRNERSTGDALYGCNSAMKTKAEILRILEAQKPELVRRYGLKRLALFGSYAREDQHENSDVDVLVEIERPIGLEFVELAERIEDAVGIRTEVVSRRAIKPRYWEVIKEELIDVP